MRTPTGSIVVALALGACGPSVEYTVLHPIERATPPAHVEVFSSGPPARPHLDAGLIVAQAGSAEANDTGELLRVIQSRAFDAGCDGVVVNAPGATNSQLVQGASNETLSATCIVWLDGK